MQYILFISLFLSFTTLAKSPQFTSEQIQTWSKEDYWRKLLRYQLVNGEVVSEVTSDYFFLSKIGYKNPQKELEQNLKQLFNFNTNTRCRFPERFVWLRTKLNLPKSQYNLNACTEFQNWARIKQLDSASLVYASGYLGSPASFFGHILLKFNYQSNAKGNNFLLDTSVNFGAITPENENPAIYIAKGMSGGYKAGFRDDAFFRHHISYAEKESRTLWEYRLNLSREQLKSLIRHTWELREQQFDYFYLDENCASRIAELISVVTGFDLISKNVPWVQPISIFQHLEKRYPNLILSVKQIPSLQDEYIHHFRMLDKTEKYAILAIKDTLNFKDKHYSTLTVQQKINVINTLLHHAEYLLKVGGSTVKQRQSVLIKERFKLPVGTNIEYKTKSHAPHSGQWPVMLRSYLSSKNNSIKIRFRPAYYDLLSMETGRLPHSSLTMADVEIESSRKGLRLSNIDLVNIITFNPAQTALESDSGLAWKIRLGLESGQSDCYDCLLGLTEFGVGKSVFINNILTYGMLEVRAQTRTTWINPVSTYAKIGALFQPSDVWKSHIEVDQLLTGDANHSEGYLSKWNLSWNNRFGNSRDWDIRINLKSNDIENTGEIGLSLYW